MADPKVTRLPTAATSFYRVRKSGKGGWAVEVVTPCPGGDLRTVVAMHASREAAVEEAERIGARRHRPVKIAGGAA
jgi:hypothetical protein